MNIGEPKLNPQLIPNERTLTEQLLPIVGIQKVIGFAISQLKFVRVPQSGCARSSLVFAMTSYNMASSVLYDKHPVLLRHSEPSCYKFVEDPSTPPPLFGLKSFHNGSTMLPPFTSGPVYFTELQSHAISSRSDLNSELCTIQDSVSCHLKRNCSRATGSV